MKRLIDEPTPFDTLATWRAFLDGLLRLNDPDADALALISKARKVIAEMEGDQGQMNR